MLQFFLFQTHAQLLGGFGVVYRLELPHEHDHSINKGGIAFERMRSPLADLFQEIVKRGTEYKDLENLQGDELARVTGHRDKHRRTEFI